MVRQDIDLHTAATVPLLDLPAVAELQQQHASPSSHHPKSQQQPQQLQGLRQRRRGRLQQVADRGKRLVPVAQGGLQEASAAHRHRPAPVSCSVLCKVRRCEKRPHAHQARRRTQLQIIFQRTQSLLNPRRCFARCGYGCKRAIAFRADSTGKICVFPCENYDQNKTTKQT